MGHSSAQCCFTVLLFVLKTKLRMIKMADFGQGTFQHLGSQPARDRCSRLLHRAQGDKGEELAVGREWVGSMSP